MSAIFKKINIIFLSFFIILLTFFVSNRVNASIFDGSTYGDTDIKFGICLSPDAKELYPDDCLNVDCDNLSGASSETIAKCTSEAEAGTALTKDALASTGITHTNNFGDYIKKLVNFSLPYLTLAAFVGYVVAGFLYVTAYGNDEQLTKAKKILIWSSVGLILVILSYAITNLFTGELVKSLAS